MPPTAEQVAGAVICENAFNLNSLHPWAPLKLAAFTPLHSTLLCRGMKEEDHGQTRCHSKPDVSSSGKWKWNACFGNHAFSLSCLFHNFLIFKTINAFFMTVLTFTPTSHIIQTKMNKFLIDWYYCQLFWRLIDCHFSRSEKSKTLSSSSF